MRPVALGFASFVFCHFISMTATFPERFCGQGGFLLSLLHSPVLDLRGITLSAWDVPGARAELRTDRDLAPLEYLCVPPGQPLPHPHPGGEQLLTDSLAREESTQS